MPWTCPDCNHSNLDDLIIKCPCGYMYREEDKSEPMSMSSIPNTIFIIYLVISFAIFHFKHARYYDFRSFYSFIFEYIGFSIIPIFFIAIYNMQKGKTVFGIISIIVSIISIIVSFY